MGRSNAKEGTSQAPKPKQERTTPCTLSPAAPSSPASPNHTTTTTISTTTSFSQLPNHLQSHILSIAVAPLATCHASAAILAHTSLLAQWLEGKHNIEERLLAAAKKGQWGGCSLLVRAGPFQDGAQCLSRVLLYAAEAGQLQLVQELLRRKAWVVDWWGKLTCFPKGDGMDEIDWEYAEAEELLLTSDHPLYLAARNGHTEVCTHLLQHLLPQRALDLNVVHRAVWHASIAGQLAVVQRIVQEGPDDLSRPGLGRNVMFEAAAYGHQAMVQYFLDQGADVFNSQGSTWSGYSTYTSCLTAAAEGGNIQLIQWLLDYCEFQGQHWSGALTTAARYNCVEALDLLLRTAPAQLPPYDSIYGSPLYVASDAGHTQVVRLLLDSGRPVGCKDHALLAAAQGQHLDILLLMLQHGANPDGPEGSQPPLAAVMYGKGSGQLAAIRALLKAGARRELLYWSKQ